MSCCGHCRDAGDFFDKKTARRDLKRYRRKGPDASTKKLIDGIRRYGREGETLLDIGGGIGAIPFELFQDGLERSMNVDASPAYQNVLREEAERRGLESRMDYRLGDFTELAEELPDAGIVTLDKVVCCYPDMDKLLESSLEKSNRLFALIFPRETVINKIGFRLGNLWFKIRKSDFRTYLHPYKKIDAKIRSHGFRQTDHEKTILWRVLVYQKD